MKSITIFQMTKHQVSFKISHLNSTSCPTSNSGKWPTPLLGSVSSSTCFPLCASFIAISSSLLKSPSSIMIHMPGYCMLNHIPLSMMKEDAASCSILLILAVECFTCLNASSAEVGTLSISFLHLPRPNTSATFLAAAFTTIFSPELTSSTASSASQSLSSILPPPRCPSGLYTQP